MLVAILERFFQACSASMACRDSPAAEASAVRSFP